MLLDLLTLFDFFFFDSFFNLFDFLAILVLVLQSLALLPRFSFVLFLEVLIDFVILLAHLRLVLQSLGIAKSIETVVSR